MSQEQIDAVVAYVTQYGLKIIFALLVLMVGKWVAGMVRKAVRPDNKGVTVPNSQIMGGQIVNFNAFPTRRLDLVFGIGYGDDVDKAKAILADLVANDERCPKEPAPTIAVNELGDSSVNIVVRPWVKGSDYWAVHFGMQEAVKKRFAAEGVSIPFPQRDVHLHRVAA